jgi:hypothetical protein
MSHCGGHHTEKIDPSDKVYKTPDELNAAYRAAAEAGSGVGPGKTAYEDYAALRKIADDLGI